jgi:hypothetical protein
MRRQSFAASLFLSALLLSSAPPASAEQAQTQFTVSARVLPVARVELLGVTPSIVITAVDIQRGYVDAPGGLALRIQTNSRSGVALDFVPQATWFSGIEIQGLDAPAALGADGGTVVQRWNGQARTELALTLRFALRLDTLPGSYALPFQLQARPLTQ